MIKAMLISIVEILYYNNKNSDKPYIIAVVCLLVTLNQRKHLNLLLQL